MFGRVRRFALHAGKDVVGRYVDEEGIMRGRSFGEGLGRRYVESVCCFGVLGAGVRLAVRGACVWSALCYPGLRVVTVHDDLRSGSCQFCLVG